MELVVSHGSLGLLHTKKPAGGSGRVADRTQTRDEKEGKRVARPHENRGAVPETCDERAETGRDEKHQSLRCQNQTDEPGSRREKKPREKEMTPPARKAQCVWVMCVCLSLPLSLRVSACALLGDQLIPIFSFVHEEIPRACSRAAGEDTLATESGLYIHGRTDEPRSTTTPSPQEGTATYTSSTDVLTESFANPVSSRTATVKKRGVATPGGCSASNGPPLSFVLFLFQPVVDRHASVPMCVNRAFPDVSMPPFHSLSSGLAGNKSKNCFICPKTCLPTTSDSVTGQVLFPFLRPKHTDLQGAPPAYQSKGVVGVGHM